MEGKDLVDALWEKYKARRLRTVNVSKVYDFLMIFNARKEQSGVKINYPATRDALDYLIELNLKNIDLLDSQVFKMERRLAGIPPPKGFKAQVQEVMNKLSLKPGKFQYDKNQFPLIKDTKRVKKKRAKRTGRPKRLPLKEPTYSEVAQFNLDSVNSSGSDIMQMKDNKSLKIVHFNGEFTDQDEESRVLSGNSKPSKVVTELAESTRRGENIVNDSNDEKPATVDFASEPKDFEHEVVDSAFDISYMPIDSFEFPNFSSPEISRNFENNDVTPEEKAKEVDVSEMVIGPSDSVLQSQGNSGNLEDQVPLEVSEQPAITEDLKVDAEYSTAGEEHQSFDANACNGDSPINVVQLNENSNSAEDVEQEDKISVPEFPYSSHSTESDKENPSLNSQSLISSPIITAKVESSSATRSSDDLFLKDIDIPTVNTRSQTYEMSKQGYIKCSPAFGANGKFGKNSLFDRDLALSKLSREVKAHYQRKGNLKRRYAAVPSKLCIRTQEDIKQYKHYVSQKKALAKAMKTSYSLIKRNEVHSESTDHQHIPLSEDLQQAVSVETMEPMSFEESNNDLLNSMSEHYERDKVTKAFLKHSDKFERPTAAGNDIKDLSLDDIMRDETNSGKLYEDAFSFSDNSNSDENYHTTSNDTNFMGNIDISDEDLHSSLPAEDLAINSMPSSYGNQEAEPEHPDHSNISSEELLIEEKSKQDHLMSIWRQQPTLPRSEIKPFQRPAYPSSLEKNEFLDPRLKDNLANGVSVGPYLPDGSQRKVFGLPYYDRQYARFMIPGEVSNYKRHKSIEQRLRSWIVENEFSYFEEIIDYFAVNYSEMHISEGELLYALGDLTDQGFIEINQCSTGKSIGAIFITRTGDPIPLTRASSSGIKMELTD